MSVANGDYGNLGYTDVSLDVIVAKRSVSPDRRELGVEDLVWLKSQGVTDVVLTHVLSGARLATKQARNGSTVTGVSKV